MDLTLLRATSHGRDIRCEDVPDAPALRWIHAATEGDYSGHSSGPFALDAAAFASMTRNFRADPRYRAGAGGKGESPVLPFDYEHASEMSATEGSIPTTGAPAPAWICEVETRKGEDGKLQLWALARLGETVRGQIERGEYRYVSIAFVANMPHFETGEPQGPTLTSIAFTNHPFLRNLTPLAASSRTRLDSPAGSALPSALQPKGTPMDLSKIIAHLASARLAGTRALANEGDVEAAVAEVSSGNASLVAVLEALGVSDAKAALAAIPDLMAAKAKLADALKQIEGLTQAQAAIEQDMAAAELEAALSAHFADDKLRETLRPALKALRATDPEAFRKQYPLPDPTKAHLLSRLVAGKGGQQLRSPDPVKIDPKDDRSTGSGAEQIDLRAYPGRNVTERLMAYVVSKSPDAAKLSHDALLAKAAELRRNPGFAFVT